MLDRSKLLALYTRLFDSYGPQHWWPAETALEVMVGAVLTQNTSWKNVETAIRRLHKARSLTLPVLMQMDIDDLAMLIRPSGFYNVKARRLKNLCHWLEQMGGIAKLSTVDTTALRSSLLLINGIGAETADDILLYALHRPVFVIDTYTRRLLVQLEMIRGDEHYESLRSAFETALGADTRLFNEYHALIVRHAKEKCKRLTSNSDVYCNHCHVETGAGLIPRSTTVMPA